MIDIIIVHSQLEYFSIFFHIFTLRGLNFVMSLSLCKKWSSYYKNKSRLCKIIAAYIDSAKESVYKCRSSACHCICLEENSLLVSLILTCSYTSRYNYAQCDSLYNDMAIFARNYGSKILIFSQVSYSKKFTSNSWTLFIKYSIDFYSIYALK